MIRPATLEDVPRLVAMGLRFRRESEYRTIFAESGAQMEQVARQLVTGDASTILVEEQLGVVVGMIALCTYPESFSGEHMAGELAFWIEPESRGTGLALIRAAEAWALGQDCRVLQLGAPNDRVERFYERLGYTPVERSYQRVVGSPVTRRRAPRRTVMQDPQIIVLDDVLPDPESYRCVALQGRFTDVTIGADTFHGIQAAPRLVGEWLQEHVPTCRTSLTFFRRSPAGQHEPHDIHSDVMMGEWTGILYLNPTPAPGDGTAFYRHRDGAKWAALEDLPRYEADFADEDCWVRWLRVPAKFNRLLLYPASYFHARALRDNYGTGDDARLIQVLFGSYDNGNRDSDRHRRGDFGSEQRLRGEEASQDGERDGGSAECGDREEQRRDVDLEC